MKLAVMDKNGPVGITPLHQPGMAGAQEKLGRAQARGKWSVADQMISSWIWSIRPARRSDSASGARKTQIIVSPSWER